MGFDSLCDPHDGGHAAFDIFVGGSPAGDGDAHGGLTVPLRTAAPASAVRLNFGDDAASLLRAAKGYEHLIQHNFVQHGETGRSQTVSEESGLAAVALNHFSQPAPSQRARRGPQLNS